MKKSKPQLTYVEAHNKAVRLYRKTVIFLMWTGIISILATVIGVFRSESGYGMSLAFNVFINGLLVNLNMPDYATYLSIFAVSIATGALFAALGFFAQQGKKVFLFIGLGLYLADFGAVFFVYGANWSTTYAFTIATHLVIVAALIIAVFEYYQVLTIERVYRGSDQIKIEEAYGEEKPL